MFNPKKVKVIVWDVDGTWYSVKGGLSDEELRQRCFVISEKLGISFEKAKKLEKETAKETKSHTKAVSVLTGMTIMEVLNTVGSRIDRSKFLKRDERLIKMFANLAKFKHVILSNMRRISLYQTMEILGVNKKIFDEIVLPDETGVTKPDLEVFRLVLKKTGCCKDEHLVVGDREDVEIGPAKKLGMQTCFVWGKSKIADVSIETVFDLSDIMLS